MADTGDLSREFREVGGESDYIEGILEGGVPEETNTGSAVGFGGLSSTLAEAGMDGESDPMYDQAVIRMSI